MACQHQTLGLMPTALRATTPVRRINVRRASERPSKGIRARHSFSPLECYCTLAINVASTIALGLWGTGVISTSQHLKLEALLLVIKAPVEHVCDSLGTDIVFHHLAMLTGCVVVSHDRYSNYAWIVSLMQCVHFPLSFEWLKRCLAISDGKEGKTKRREHAQFFLAGIARKCFLITWLPVVSFRCGAIGCEAIKNLLRGNVEQGSILVIFAALFLFLDYSWTPWRKYSKLLEGLVSRNMWHSTQATRLRTAAQATAAPATRLTATTHLLRRIPSEG